MEDDSSALDGTSADSQADSHVTILLSRRQQLTDKLADSPYDLILYLRRAVVYADLGYPDLAAGDAYRALLLTDEVGDESFEYHEQAVEALSAYLDSSGGDLLPDVLRYGTLGEKEAAEDAKAPKDEERKEDGEEGAKEEGADGEETSISPQKLAACQKLAMTAAIRCYQVLSFSLLLCGCLRSAYNFSERGLAAAPNNKELQETKGYIDTMARRRLRQRRRDSSADDDDGAADAESPLNPADLPDRGVVRREVYPWNSYEPDRFSAESLAFLNKELAQAAPKCEVRATELPVLVDLDGGNPDAVPGSDSDSNAPIPTCKQLGIFAKEPIAAGEAVLREYSLLTANNRLKESTCDACGTALPELGGVGGVGVGGAAVAAAPTDSGSTGGPVSCPDCDDTAFCDAFCLEQAQARYHPAVCGNEDVDAVAKEPKDPRDADDALYVRLLARLLAIAAHEDVHPLDVREVKYIWGDFLPSRANSLDLLPSAGVPQGAALPPPAWTLPFSFAANVEAPLHLLEKMDVDVFAALARYDVWVCNTLYAKFRGTASARKSRRDGRPDVAAVHPLWCLANHDCDPNVTWEWGGRMVLWARQERVRLQPAGPGGGGGDKTSGRRPGGIAAGEEVLNHYCDVDLPVQQRREWASGSLGGWCMCQRCRNEAAAEAESAADAAAAAAVVESSA